MQHQMSDSCDLLMHVALVSTGADTIHVPLIQIHQDPLTKSYRYRLTAKILSGKHGCPCLVRMGVLALLCNHYPYLDVLYVPAQGLKTGVDILCEGDLGVSRNGDLVVIVQSNELAQAPVTGQGAGLI